jgi:hypothetical protein
MTLYLIRTFLLRIRRPPPRDVAAAERAATVRIELGSREELRAAAEASSLRE